MTSQSNSQTIKKDITINYILSPLSCDCIAFYDLFWSGK